MINDGINQCDLDTKQKKKKKKKKREAKSKCGTLNKDFQSNSLKSSQGVNWGGLNTKCLSTSF